METPYVWYYDLAKGFENDKPNWHTIKLNNNFDDYFKFQDYTLQVMKWLYENIDNPERHCRWICEGDRIQIRFRYLRDYQWFSLRWS